ncbi:MAG: DpnI domain-containing protein [Verrucomicrobiota bacterium]|jgi:type II restriction enzyme
MTGALAADYHSGAQRARVVTESWGESNLYCPNCSSPKLTWLEPGHPASDYSCPKCRFWFQLKSQKSRIGDSITDGAYAAMMRAYHNDEMPSFYFMQYELMTWRVRNLLLVPHFAFPPSAIIKRNPTTPKGRGKPWVGCNFALNRIPDSARIPVINEEAITPPAAVRQQYQLVRKQVEGLTVKQRGWRLDVLRVIQSLGNAEFSTSDVYAFERELAQLHPDNDHVKAKIRQQLQDLRDRQLLLHIDRNRWRLP